MFKFLKNDSKKKSIENVNDTTSDETCTLDYAEKLICDNETDFEYHEPQIKLHRNLVDILKDRTTLSFFVQFLETKNGLPWVKFWLDCEAFKALSSDAIKSSTTTIRTDDSCNGNKLKDDDCVSSTTSYSESNLDETEETTTTTSDEVDNVKVQALTQSLTDDEKSKIFCNEKKKSKKSQPSIQEDALRIYRKYLVTDSIDSIELPATILSKLSLALCDSKSECDDENYSNLFDAFDDAQKHVMDMMEKDFLTNFLESSFYFKYSVDVLTSDTLNFLEILKCDAALFFFTEFLEQEDKNHCKLTYLEFWLAATNFRKQDDQSLQQMRADALVIYEKWFSLQAINSLNISSRVRTRIEESICSLDAAIFQTFDIPIRIVEVFLENCCFKKFLKSQLFFKHLSEVMTKAEGSDKMMSNHHGIIRRSQSIGLNFGSNVKHRRTLSDATKSISTQNTLLAGLDRKNSNKNAADLHIDSRQLDPDMLWRRKSSGGLSFGRVDALGRYERDFELPTNSTNSSISHSKSSFQLKNHTIDVDDPQSVLELNNAQSKFKNAMKKLVHMQDDDDEQQEIAWQVAEMIVKDVTSITLATGQFS